MRAYFRILSQFTLCLMVVISLGMLLFPTLARPTQAKPDPCASNLKQVALAIFQYTQDYDDKFPIIRVNDTGVSDENPWGWADALRPYVDSAAVFHCPSNAQYKNKSRPKNPKSWGYNDYFYNSRLARVSQADVEAISLTVMLGDGNDGTDSATARYSLNALPAKWGHNQNSPSKRHNGGAYYAYADGHVKWQRFDAITTRPIHESRYTFVVK